MLLGTLIDDDSSETTAAEARVIDRDLVQRVAEGDADALAAVYDRHAPAVFGLAFRITEAQDDAATVVLAVFARLRELANRYDASRGPVASWLLLLTRSLAIGRRRERVAAPAGVSPPAVVELPDPAMTTGPVTTTAAARRLRAAVAGLPLGDRLPLELAYFHGLTRAEIAAALGLPPSVIARRIRAGLLALREPEAR